MNIVTIDALHDVMNYYLYSMIPMYSLMILLIWSLKKSVAGELSKYVSLFIVFLSFASVVAQYIWLSVLADYQVDAGLLFAQNHVFLLIIFVAVVILITKGIKKNKNEEKS